MIEIKRLIFTLVCLVFLNTTTTIALGNTEFIPYINSCSGIRQYSGDKKDLNKLVLDVLNNHQNFQAMSSIAPVSTETGALKMCNANFIDDIMYKTFRIKTPRPAPNQLTELGYYYNNNFYYYRNNSAILPATVDEITKVIPLDDGGVYVIFTDILTTDNSHSTVENSAIKLQRDNSGWFVTAIHMGLDFSNLSEHLKTPEPQTPYIEFVWNILPIVVFILTITVAIVILYKLVLF